MALNNLQLLLTNVHLRIEVAHLKRHIESLNDRVRMAEAMAERAHRQNQHGNYIRVIAANLHVPQDKIIPWVEQMWNNHVVDTRRNYSKVE